SSIHHKRHTLELLVTYLSAEYQIKHWREVTAAHLGGFAAWAGTKCPGRRARDVSASTMRQWLSRLSGFFRWLKSTHRLLHNPAEYLKYPHADEPHPRALSEPEIARLIEMPDLAG